MPLYRRVIAYVAWTVLGVAVLVGGFRVAKKLEETKPAAKRVASWTRPIPAQFVELEFEDRFATVHATGTVVAAQQLLVQPEVTGKLLETHPELRRGGLVRAGEPLVRIDDRDFVLAARARKADIARAKLELKTEKRRQRVAEREWELLSAEIDIEPEGKALSLREPQLASANAQLASAQAALDTARLQIERTRIQSPMNAMVMEQTAEVGQLVSPGARLATLVGTDAFWVEVAVPFDQVPSLRIPGVNAPASEGAAARVRLKSGERIVTERQGRVLRMLPDVAAAGRMARLLVEVSDPLQLELPPEARDAPLMLGAFVRVELEGRRLQDVVRVPLAQLHEGDVIHLAREPRVLGARVVEPGGMLAGVALTARPGDLALRVVVPQAITGPLTRRQDVLARLDVRPVEVVHRELDVAWVRGEGLHRERMLTTRLASPVPNAWLRPLDADGHPSAGRLDLTRAAAPRSPADPEEVTP